MDKEQQKQLEIKLQGIMEFYIKEFFNSGFREEAKVEMAKYNPGFIDPEMLDIQIDQYIDVLINEATEKFHNVAFLVLSLLASGKEPSLRHFEVLFIDLVKRTLIKEVKEEKQATPIVVIADPNVAGNKE